MGFLFSSVEQGGSYKSSKRKERCYPEHIRCRSLDPVSMRDSEEIAVPSAVRGPPLCGSSAHCSWTSCGRNSVRSKLPAGHIPDLLYVTFIRQWHSSVKNTFICIWTANSIKPAWNLKNVTYVSLHFKETYY